MVPCADDRESLVVSADVQGLPNGAQKLSLVDGAAAAAPSMATTPTASPRRLPLSNIAAPHLPEGAGLPSNSNSFFRRPYLSKIAAIYG